MIQITESLRYYPREDWTPDARYPRQGEIIHPSARTEAIMHHSVAIDNDLTPNIWEDEAEIFAKMRQLQTIRPELQLDVPYNSVAFLCADAKLAVCEGRGPDRRGAHTKYHNKTGIALCIEGNMEDYYTDLRPYVPALSRFWGWYRTEFDLLNLGTKRPSSGRAIFGHRDFAATACPGQHTMAYLQRVTFDEGDDMTPEEKAELELLRKQMDFALAVIADQDRRLKNAGGVLAGQTK